MSTVKSIDGTTIAYEAGGGGPAVIFVGGGLDDGSENAPLALEMARSFTVFNYARRGRGDSGNTPPYALAREVEDIDALITKAGGTAHLFGASSGGALALEAAIAGLSIDRLAVYEVPYMADDASARHWSEYVDQLHTALAEGRRGDAVGLFMRLAGSSDDDVAMARSSSYWPGLVELAPTLAYDAACLGDGPVPEARLATVTQPTLVATGAVPDPHMGELQPGFFDHAADAIAAAIPSGERRIVEGQSHIADPKVLGAVLAEYFSA